MHIIHLQIPPTITGFNHHWFQPFDSSMILGNVYQSQLVKVEDQCVFTPEEPYSFLSVDQAPTLQRYFTGQ
ncbi:hypothetical protein GQ457_07G023820 [Hibiscus cannabinus]